VGSLGTSARAGEISPLRFAPVEMTGFGGFAPVEMTGWEVVVDAIECAGDGDSAGED
jgi:hypothetical protein